MPEGLHHVEVRPGLGFDLRNAEEWWRQPTLYEPEVVDVITRFVGAGDRCIDAGANHGYHTLLMSKLVGPDGGVVAFEPDPNHFRTLSDNVALNGVDNVCVLELGLWDSAGQQEFLVVEGGGYSSFCVRYESKPLIAKQIETMALDALDIGAIRLLKIDCEGAEQFILFGARQLLTSGIDCVIVEFHFEIMTSMGVNPDDIVRYMRSLGYDYFLLRRNGGNVQPPLHVPINWNVTFTTSGVRVCNVVFAKLERMKALYPEMVCTP